MPSNTLSLGFILNGDKDKGKGNELKFSASYVILYPYPVSLMKQPASSKVCISNTTINNLCKALHTTTSLYIHDATSPYVPRLELVLTIIHM